MSEQNTRKTPGVNYFNGIPVHVCVCLCAPFARFIQRSIVIALLLHLCAVFSWGSSARHQKLTATRQRQRQPKNNNVLYISFVCLTLFAFWSLFDRSSIWIRPTAVPCQPAAVLRRKFFVQIFGHFVVSARCLYEYAIVCALFQWNQLTYSSSSFPPLRSHPFSSISITLLRQLFIDLQISIDCRLFFINIHLCEGTAVPNARHNDFDRCMQPFWWHQKIKSRKL